MKKFLVIGFLLLGFVIAGCGGDSHGESTMSVDSSNRWPDLERLAGAGKGRLIIPTGPPPEKVVIKDLENGNGRRIKQGDWFRISYVAFDYQTRNVTEDKRGIDSWEWTWGGDLLSQGWEIGLKGLRVGDLRELIVPSRLAYGTGARVYVLRLLRIEERPKR